MSDGRQPSSVEMRLAAQIRVRADRARQHPTPQWIVDLAGEVPERRSWWRRIADRWRR